MIEIKFNHENSNIPTAMGLSTEIDKKCREIVNFSTFSIHLIKEEFFGENEDEAPANMTTVTGVLEKALNLCINDAEKAYTLFVFKQVHEHANQAMSAWQCYKKEDEKERKKMELMLNLVELKALVEDDDKANYVTPKDMFSKIEIAKENMYNFEKYYALVSEK